MRQALSYFDSFVTQYGVDAFGDGKSNRAFTAYRRLPSSAIVVGKSRFAGSLMRRTTRPLLRFGESAIFATTSSAFCTTYSVLPSSRIPSPFGTLSPPASAIVRATPFAPVVKSLPVFDWTKTSVFPFGVASMPLTLKFAPWL